MDLHTIETRFRTIIEVPAYAKPPILHEESVYLKIGYPYPQWWVSKKVLPILLQNEALLVGLHRLLKNRSCDNWDEIWEGQDSESYHDVFAWKVYLSRVGQGDLVRWKLIFTETDGVDGEASIYVWARDENPRAVFGEAPGHIYAMPELSWWEEAARATHVFRRRNEGGQDELVYHDKTA